MADLALRWKELGGNAFLLENKQRSSHTSLSTSGDESASAKLHFPTRVDYSQNPAQNFEWEYGDEKEPFFFDGDAWENFQDALKEKNKKACDDWEAFCRSEEDFLHEDTIKQACEAFFGIYEDDIDRNKENEGLVKQKLLASFADTFENRLLDEEEFQYFEDKDNGPRPYQYKIFPENPILSGRLSGWDLVAEVGDNGGKADGIYPEQPPPTPPRIDPAPGAPKLDLWGNPF